MSKQLTAKQLGIPSGYRLSVTNNKNIVNVAIKHLYKKRLIAMVQREGLLLQEIVRLVYPKDLLNNLYKAVEAITGQPFSYRRYENQIIVDTGGNSDTLGGSNYSFIKDKRITVQIIKSSIFNSIIEDLSEKELKSLNIKGDQGDSKTSRLESSWFEYETIPGHLVSNQGRISAKSLPSDLKKKFNRFIDARFELVKEVEEKRLLIQGLLSYYNSAVKLCNDAPEFVEWINDAKIFNKDGRKCTDVTTHDMIAKLRK